MPPRQRAEPLARGRTGERRQKKGRLTLQAAQGWEERDGRTDAAHRTISFAERVVEIQAPPVGGRRRLAILAEESRFGSCLPGKISDLACAQHMACRLILATRLRPPVEFDPPGRCIEQRNETAPAGKRRRSLRACPPARR